MVTVEPEHLASAPRPIPVFNLNPRSASPPASASCSTAPGHPRHLASAAATADYGVTVNADNITQLPPFALAMSPSGACRATHATTTPAAGTASPAALDALKRTPPCPPRRTASARLPHPADRAAPAPASERRPGRLMGRCQAALPPSPQRSPLADPQRLQPAPLRAPRSTPNRPPTPPPRPPASTSTSTSTTKASTQRRRPRPVPDQEGRRHPARGLHHQPLGRRRPQGLQPRPNTKPRPSTPNQAPAAPTNPRSAKSKSNRPSSKQKVLRLPLRRQAGRKPLRQPPHPLPGRPQPRNRRPRQAGARRSTPTRSPAS